MSICTNSTHLLETSRFHSIKHGVVCLFSSKSGLACHCGNAVSAGDDAAHHCCIVFKAGNAPASYLLAYDKCAEHICCPDFTIAGVTMDLYMWDVEHLPRPEELEVLSVRPCPVLTV